MARGLLVAAIAVASAFASEGDSVLALTPTNFHKVIGGPKAVFAKF